MQEREIGSSGYAMPSPQIRAIFAPLYQEQGSFKGAHYVTEEEKTTGLLLLICSISVPHLKPYGDIGTINDDNATGQPFISCRATSSKCSMPSCSRREYGVGRMGPALPGDFHNGYNDMMNTLFTNAVRVSVRDGVQGNWSDSLGSGLRSNINCFGFTGRKQCLLSQTSLVRSRLLP